MPSFNSATGPSAAVIGADGSLGSRLVRALCRAKVPTLAYTGESPALRQGVLASELLEAPVVFFVPDRLSPAAVHRDPGRANEDLVELRTVLAGLSAGGRRPVVVLEGSGGTVYDTAGLPPYHERAAVKPATAYGRAKLAQEKALAEAADGVAPVVLRIANFYGPGQRTGTGYGVVGHWMEAVLTGEPVRILGDGASRRDYVHLADVMSAMLAVVRRAPALRAEEEPVVLNIGTGVATSLDELHRALEAVVGRPVEVEREAARSFDRQDYWLDIRRAAEVLGWHPEIALRDGLTDTWRHCRANRGARR